MGLGQPPAVLSNPLRLKMIFKMPRSGSGLRIEVHHAPLDIREILGHRDVRFAAILIGLFDPHAQLTEGRQSLKSPVCFSRAFPCECRSRLTSAILATATEALFCR
jgi:hypothetical protein